MNKQVRGGQVGLLLLVIMGVVVAVVMSVASRSLSDTVLSRQERESSAAFAVAETGIERAMNELRNSSGQPIGGPLTGLSDFVSGEYLVTPSTSYGLYVREGETAHLDLTTFVPTLTIAWSKKGDRSEDLACGTEGSGGSAAGIEITAIQGSSNSVQKSYYNASNCSTFPNSFANSADGGATYRSTVTYSVPTVPSNATVIRIKPLYSGATISVGGAGLEDQLYLIQSKATGGDAQKEIEVKRGLDAPPSIFDFAVFTAGTIVK